MQIPSNLIDREVTLCTGENLDHNICLTIGFNPLYTAKNVNDIMYAARYWASQLKEPVAVRVEGDGVLSIALPGS